MSHDLDDGAVRATLSRALDVVDADAGWRILHAPLGEVSNLARSVFEHPMAAWFFVDVRLVELAAVARLRACLTGAGREADLIADLHGRSPRFRALWDGPVVAHRPRGPYEVRTRELGALSLVRSSRRVPEGWHDVLVPRDRRTADTLVTLLGLA